MITFAKGVTSGSVPMGGVLVRKGIYDAFMQGPSTSSNCSTATPIRRIRSPAPRVLATLDLYREENLFEPRASLRRRGRNGAEPQRSANVLDIRPVGMTVGIDLASKPDGVGKRGAAALEIAFPRPRHYVARRRRHAGALHRR